jgi:hypothetical protein
MMKYLAFIPHHHRICHQICWKCTKNSKKCEISLKLIWVHWPNWAQDLLIWKSSCWNWINGHGTMTLTLNWSVFNWPFIPKEFANNYLGHPFNCPTSQPCRLGWPRIGRIGQNGRRDGIRIWANE